MVAQKGKKKLTAYTADAFIVTTDHNIPAAIHLFSSNDFSYILPAVFSQDPLEKVFGTARQRCGGNFYIDYGDVLAVAKIQVNSMHQLLKHDLIPDKCLSFKCPNCTEELDYNDLDALHMNCAFQIHNCSFITLTI